LTQVLRPLSEIYDRDAYPQVLVGLSEPDDAAVYQLDDSRAIISTTDFFPPVVDDPYDFGAIAAANALSDVYAMGGQPLMAINLVAFPDDLDKTILSEILRGGAEKVKEAGAVIAGGHSITDAEPKYGLSVTGEVAVNKIIRKSGAQAGDVLILSKRLGTGVVTTALKRDIVAAEHLSAAVRSMSRLNRVAADLAQQHCVHAMTDITGFGLVGHGLEMAKLSGVNFRLNLSQLALLPGAGEYARAGIFPGGMERNRDYYGAWLTIDGPIDEYQHGLLFDPQTSGGLLMAVCAQRADKLLADLQAQGEDAFVLGDVIAGSGKIEVTKLA
jgi:selenide,water dikinase